MLLFQGPSNYILHFPLKSYIWYLNNLKELGEKNTPLNSENRWTQSEPTLHRCPTSQTAWKSFLGMKAIALFHHKARNLCSIWKSVIKYIVTNTVIFPLFKMDSLILAGLSDFLLVEYAKNKSLWLLGSVRKGIMAHLCGSVVEGQSTYELGNHGLVPGQGTFPVADSHSFPLWNQLNIFI